MTPNDFRRIALGMHGAVEGEHMAHPDFRANGRIFATIAPGATKGMVALTPDQQRQFMDADPRTFVPAAGAWGRGGATMVQFASADSETVGEAMTFAWQGAMNRPAAKRKAPRKKARPQAVRPAKKVRRS